MKNKFLIILFFLSLIQIGKTSETNQEIISLIEHGGEGVSMGIEARKTVQIMMGFLNSNHSGSVLIDV